MFNRCDVAIVLAECWGVSYDKVTSYYNVLRNWLAGNQLILRLKIVHKILKKH